MKKISITAILWMVFICLSFASFAQSEQEQKIQSSYILAFNRKASTGEVNYWKTQGNLSVAQLLDKHKNYIKSNPGIWDGIMNASYTDAFGRVITDGEKSYHKPYPRTYLEMINSHVDFLNKNPAIYEEVLVRSFNRALGRKPTNVELNYWKSQTKCSFIWLFRAHIQSAASSTKNVASTKDVVKQTVSPSVLQDVKAAVSSLVAAGGGNLIGNDGSTLVAAGGGNLVGNDGASLVAAGGGN